ncbi:MAG: hypothetical protein GY952_15670 [Rhodobacteraceae bacterium]|nr:hypothetical protein [Paracoccaceae bacterium]
MKKPLSCLALILAASVVPHSAAAKTDEDPCPPAQKFDILKEIERTVGLPKVHFELDREPENAPWGFDRICRDRYCLLHNPVTKQPVWVMARLNRSVVCGAHKRPDKWKFETAVTDDAPVAKNTDYTGSGFARGHQAASADFQADQTHMEDTFYFSNAVPQFQNGFNGSYWRFLEDHVQTLAMNGQDLIVITGPVHRNEDGDTIVVKKSQNACGYEIRLPGVRPEHPYNKPSVCKANKGKSGVKCPNGVTVPAGMYKIIYNTENKRVFAYLMGNYDHRNTDDEWPDNDDYLEQHRVSVDAIEKLTDVEFFPLNNVRRNKVDKSYCIPTRMH